jgi:hypothetical protein
LRLAGRSGLNPLVSTLPRRPVNSSPRVKRHDSLSPDIGQCSGVMPEDVRLDPLGADEFSLVGASLGRTDRQPQKAPALVKELEET